ncbi:MAG: FtsX-like permease family protein [bacterium]|nr:FtsX-like permease family protein [bacterium]
MKKNNKKYSLTELIIKNLFPDTMEANLGDFIEVYNERLTKKGRLTAFMWFIEFIIKSYPPALISGAKRRIMMFRNYLKTAFRNLNRYRGYSLINITGLSAALTCCIFILIYIQYETSWDSYHENSDRIYRINSSLSTSAGIRDFAGIAPQVTEYIKEDLPQSERTARIWSSRDANVRYADIMFKEEGKGLVYTDNDIFNIFHLPLKKGDPGSALTRPHTVILSEQTSRKYFGDADPVGEVIKIDAADFEITGVAEKLPGNSILKFNILISWKTFPANSFHNSWGGFIQTFVKLNPDVEQDHFANLITDVMNEKNASAYQSRGEEFSATLQPLKDIYLHSSTYLYDQLNHGNLTNIYIFGCIAVILFLIASFNFMNLSTARSINRACEVGMRKVAGAHRSQLIFQFIGESMLLAVISFGIAIGAVLLFMRSFSQLTMFEIDVASLLRFDFIIVSMLLIFGIGIAAGCYPALILSSFKPASILRGSVRTGLKRGTFRKILVIGQFSLSIIMIVGAIIFALQLDYMKNATLGFEKEQKLIINTDGNGVNQDNYNSFKNEFVQISAVSGASFSSSVPGRWLYQWRIWPTGEQRTNTKYLRVMSVDEDYFSLYNIEFIQPVDALEIFRSNRLVMSWMINESAVSGYGWDSPDEALTKTLMDGEITLTGVYKDYHFTGLQSTIEPQAIGFIDDDFRYLTLQINTEDIRSAISSIEQQYKKLFPDRVFDYFFLDDDFDSQYMKEERISRIFGIFTVMGILIACLGLFGMAAFMAEQRTKEIGIRKVMGSTVNGIVNLLLKEFVYLVAFANIIAWPVSYYFMDRWLQDFAYRINIPLWSFFLSGFIAILIALLSSGYQSLRAARTNPVDSLRYE